MRTLLTVFAAAGLAVVLMSGLCESNTPPDKPTVTGPSSAGDGDTLTFRVTATDPEGDNVQFKLDYGDGTTPEWTPIGYSSGMTISRKHAFADTGSYEVKVMARDEDELESEWSDPLTVAVELRAPLVPAPPTGPVACTTGHTYYFSVTTSHPLGDSLWFQFDWGDTTGNWSGPVASDSSYTGVHVWGEPGDYDLRVRARDAEERTSGWSNTLAVNVIKLAGGIPTGFRISSAGSGLQVRLLWTEPAEGTPDEYLVLYRHQGAGDFDTIARPVQTYHVHDPQTLTGEYRLLARYDTAYFAAPETLSTIPVYSAVMTIYELNGSGDQGYGWDTLTGSAGAYSMGEAGNASRVDLYFSDFDPGHELQPYTMATPSFGPNDPGGGVPPGNWRETYFTYVHGSENDPLPEYSGQTYVDLLDVNSTPLLVAGYTEDTRYALIRVVALDSSTAEVQLESWLQPVAGLRLIEH